MLNLTINKLRLIAKKEKKYRQSSKYQYKKLKNSLNKRPLSSRRPIKHKLTPVLINVDKFGKSGMTKLAENA